MSPDAGEGQAQGALRSVLTREAFAERYRAASSQLWVVAVAIVRNAAVAEDVVQESALVALGKLDQFDAGTSFEAWMSQIVRFTALNASRRQARGGKTVGDDGVMAGIAAEESSPEPPAVSTFGQLLADQEGFDADVQAALNELDDTARACLLLRTVLDAPYARISELLGIPEGTAMSHVHRSRKAMRNRLLQSGKGAQRDRA